MWRIGSEDSQVPGKKVRKFHGATDAHRAISGSRILEICTHDLVPYFSESADGAGAAGVDAAVVVAAVGDAAGVGSALGVAASPFLGSW